MKDNNNNVNRPSKGLHTDSSPIDQPKGTYRYAKNAVLESREGDVGFISNELSNKVCALLPQGYIPIGKTYMTGGEVALFLVKEDETLSEIGILTENCKYETVVNTDLGFKISNQIDATYKLRRGCERTVYFVEEGNKPRIFNFDDLESFQDNSGNWVANKFNLFKTYDEIPSFSNIEIEESGQLPPGSYNFAIQYLDEDFNPTEWINTTDTIIIYNDNTASKSFKDVRGSTNKITDYQDYGATNKSIKLTLDNLDKNFTYYRIAVIESNNGSGQVSRVIYSQEVSTEVNTYIYTGSNAFVEGTEEEIQQFNNVIDRARHIEQIENRLILGDVKGKQLNFCRLQKYASKIKANLVTQQIILNDTEFKDNPKRGQVHNEKVGYMPGEIYSFGIVWVFKDGTTSPVYHIPGRNPEYGSEMSSENSSQSSVYLANNSCSGEDFWGYDSQGQALTGQPIRHHRFPLRSEVNKPLLVKEGTSSEIQTNTLFLDITGDIANPPVTEESLEYQVNYTVGGASFQKTLFIDVTNYDPEEGLVGVVVDSSIEEIVFTSVTEIPTGGGAGVDPSTNSTLTYTPRIEDSTTVLEDSIYTAEIFGIEFSNIDLPSEEDLNGEEIVGYHIVRNERTETEKTILDTGLITPLIDEKEPGVDKFVAFGHLRPNKQDPDGLKKDIFGLFHPEHRFRQKEYTGVTELIQEGSYVLSQKNISDEIVQDVQAGTSYDSSVNKRRERDSDGFDLHVMTRHNLVDYVRAERLLANSNEIEDIFYLDTLFNKTVTDTSGTRKDVFNMSGDNKTGIVQLNKELDAEEIKNNLPLVVMKRSLANPYGNFRVLPYYKENLNIFTLNQAENNFATVFNGDSYISSFRYVSSCFYDLRLRSRRRKKGILNFVIGYLAIITGALLVATGVGVAAGIAVAGLGVSQLATGFKKYQAAKVYQDLYEQGLQNTVDDDDTEDIFGPNPEDDEIQWFTDVLTNVWLESNVNMNWRQGNTIGLTDFLPSPDGYDENQINTYAIEKVTNIDPGADGGRTYQGYPKAEIYEVNLDYFRRNKQKTFTHLALEYDCCSKCLEEFPHRIHYSEQSFQEELTDNYRTFLPNNYRDLEGETGHINNIFRIQNNLYLHTEEALWHLPQNIQERVTGVILSFIGTGDFFSIPPRKVLDDETGNSAGTQHKWGMIKTPHGVFFVSENQNIVYKFNGNNLEPISNLGEFSWFKNNITVEQDEQYYDLNTKQYPYRDNPSNKFGTGYIITYDSRFERVLVTKKDFTFSPGQIDTNTPYEICVDNGNLIVHENVEDTVAQEEGDGWSYTGINENCELEFERVTTETIQVEKTTSIPNEADIHVFYDTSGSFGSIGGDCLNDIDEAIDNWLASYATENPNWTGNVYKYEDDTERWLNYASIIESTTYAGQDISTKDIIVISFCNEATPVYHNSVLDSPIENPTVDFINDYNNFITLQSQYKSFLGINYPIVFGEDAGNCGGSGGGSLPSSKNFLLHSIAALYGTEMTASQIAEELSNQNPGFTNEEWEQLKTDLQSFNPYPDDGLINYGWIGKWDRAADEDGNVISSVQFQEDIEELLAGTTTITLEPVEVETLEYKTIPGRIINDPVLLDCSWTKSFNLKFNCWVSYHDYFPNFYVNSPDRLYSWRYGNDNLWVHNVEHSYQTYYGELKDYVVEYVSLSNPLQTRIWNHIRLITEATKFDKIVQYAVDQRFITFNQAILYNTRQNSGLLNLVCKDTQDNPEDYLLQQIQSKESVSIINKNEKDWTINDFRDMVSNYNIPMFLKDKNSVQGSEFYDKVLNTNAIDLDKDWTNQEPFRDKYLIIRLIFNTFGDTKLVLNYSIENENISHR